MMTIILLMVFGWLWSAAWGAISRFGVPGLIAVAAAVILFFGMKRFAGTPRGMLIVAGVLAAALALIWLMPGGSSQAGSGQQAARNRAAEAARWRQMNAAADQANAKALAAMMPRPGMGAGLAAPSPPMGFGSIAVPSPSASQAAASGTAAQAGGPTATAPATVARSSQAPAPVDPPAMSPGAHSAAGAGRLPTKPGSALAQAGQGAQSQPADKPATGPGPKPGPADNPPAAKPPTGKDLGKPSSPPGKNRDPAGPNARPGPKGAAAEPRRGADAEPGDGQASRQPGPDPRPDGDAGCRYHAIRQ